MADAAKDDAESVWYVGIRAPGTQESNRSQITTQATTQATSQVTTQPGAKASYTNGRHHSVATTGAKTAGTGFAMPEDEAAGSKRQGATVSRAGSEVQGIVPGTLLDLESVGKLARRVPPMLFVGGKVAAMEIGRLWQRLQQAEAGPPELGLILTTTQKHALRLLRTISPLFVMVETVARPNSRTRFGGILRTRLADTPVVAVGVEPVGDFCFDDLWLAPYQAEGFLALVERMRLGSDPHIIQHGALRLDVLTRTVDTPNGRHRMTPKQCALLHLLLDHHDQVVSRKDIMRTIWETTYMEDTRTLDVHIRWLRQVIEPDPSEPIYLRTVRGKGYHLSLPVPGAHK